MTPRACRYIDLVATKACYKNAPIDWHHAVAKLKPHQVCAMDHFNWLASCCKHLDVLYQLEDEWVDAPFSMDAKYDSKVYKCAVAPSCDNACMLVCLLQHAGADSTALLR